MDEGAVTRFLRKFHPRNLTKGGRALSRDLNAIDREDEVEGNKEVNQAKYNSAISKLRLQQSKNFNPMRTKGYYKQRKDAGNKEYYLGPQGEIPRSFGPGVDTEED